MRVRVRVRVRVSSLLEEALGILG
jgi:hypothetical protein